MFKNFSKQAINGISILKNKYVDLKDKCEEIADRIVDKINEPSREEIDKLRYKVIGILYMDFNGTYASHRELEDKLKEIGMEIPFDSAYISIDDEGYVKGTVLEEYEDLFPEEFYAKAQKEFLAMHVEYIKNNKTR